MGAKGIVAAGVAVVAVLGGGAYYFLQDEGPGDPQKVADAYFVAWDRGQLERMEKLADRPPADFVTQHKSLSTGLGVTAISLEPTPVVRDGKDGAHADFEVSRDLGSHGTWKYRSRLRLVLARGRWRVQWAPATLYPGLKGQGTWSLREIPAGEAEFVASDGRALPKDSTSGSYVTQLGERFGGIVDAGSESARNGWAIGLTDDHGPERRVTVLGSPTGGKKVRTTLDRGLQAAADRVLSEGGKSAAIVAIRPSTGEILAVGDTLSGGSNAFLGLYPPGSTFKVVTAAALLADGAGPDTAVDCPGSAVTAQRTINNHDGLVLGRTNLARAFAESCNTTFAKLGVERLGAGKLAAQARAFGFDGPISPGVPAARGSFPEPGSGAELAEDSIGQGKVEASPLMMAVVAAASADGTWRSPRLLPADMIRKYGEKVQKSHGLAGAGRLRTLMRAVVTDGTGSRAGFPAGVSGKTGTAEYGGGSHAWFIGFRGDLAFAVFVEGGGSGPKVAAPLAARFLKSG